MRWGDALQWRGTMTPEEFFHLRTTREYRKTIVWGRLTLVSLPLIIGSAVYESKYDSDASNLIIIVVFLWSINTLVRQVVWTFRAGLGQMFTAVLAGRRPSWDQPPPRFTRAMRKQWRRDVWIPGEIRRVIGPPAQDPAMPETGTVDGS